MIAQQLGRARDLAVGPPETSYRIVRQPERDHRRAPASYRPLGPEPARDQVRVRDQGEASDPVLGIVPAVVKDRVWGKDLAEANGPELGIVRRNYLQRDDLGNALPERVRDHLERDNDHPANVLRDTDRGIDRFSVRREYGRRDIVRREHVPRVIDLLAIDRRAPAICPSTAEVIGVGIPTTVGVGATTIAIGGAGRQPAL